MADTAFNPQPDEPTNQQSMMPGVSPQNEVATLAVCPCDTTISATGVDSTHVRVTFDPPVLDNAAIRCVSVWVVLPPGGSRAITVLAVEPESDPVETILLTTTEHVTLPDYDVRLHFLEIA